jgi:hypothetical protein
MGLQKKINEQPMTLTPLEDGKPIYGLRFDARNFEQEE